MTFVHWIDMLYCALYVALLVGAVRMVWIVLH